MNARAAVVACAVVLSAANTAFTQVNIQPTPQPLVTAENERWYRTGEPVSFSGNLYYPAGPAIHFNANEMVRSGFHLGVPLYSRTTIEPFSLVFVPIGRGLMQPYERRRDGEIAGTSSSTPPALPVVLTPAGPVTFAAGTTPIQAAAPPIVESGTPVLDSGIREAPAAPPSAPPAAQSIGTSGRPAAPIRVRRDAPNGIFVEFDHARWFSSGAPVLIDAQRLTRIGEMNGFPVYAARGAGDTTIYVPVAQGLDVLARYVRK